MSDVKEYLETKDYRVIVFPKAFMVKKEPPENTAFAMMGRYNILGQVIDPTYIHVFVKDEYYRTTIHIFKRNMERGIGNWLERLEGNGNCSICDELVITAITCGRCSKSVCDRCIVKNNLKCPFCRHQDTNIRVVKL